MQHELIKTMIMKYDWAHFIVNPSEEVFDAQAQQEHLFDSL